MASIAVGVRAEVDAFSWGVVTRTAGGDLLALADGTHKGTRTFDATAKLVEARQRMVQVVTSYSPTVGNVRTPETAARVRYAASLHARLRLEGVLAEAMASRGLTVILGALVSIAGEMGSKSAASAKAYLAGEGVRGLRWEGRPMERREALLAAIAALEHIEHDEGSNGYQE